MICGAFPLARVPLGPTTVSAIALSPVSPLPVSLPPQLRVSTAEVEHMPIHLSVGPERDVLDALGVAGELSAPLERVGVPHGQERVVIVAGHEPPTVGAEGWVVIERSGGHEDRVTHAARADPADHTRPDCQDQPVWSGPQVRAING
jgi:hypothetical protein